MTQSRLLLLCSNPFLVADITWCAQRAGFDVATARFQEGARDALERSGAEIVLVHRDHEARLDGAFHDVARRIGACVLTFDKHPAREELRIFGATSSSVQLRRGQEPAFYTAVLNACSQQGTLARAG